jgi:hypothetical protein
MDRLYFATRTDMPGGEGRRAAQIAHAMERWNARFGPHNATVVIYQVDSEEELLSMLPDDGRTVLWREPDFDNEATAFATDAGRMNLPLLGVRGKRRNKR